MWQGWVREWEMHSLYNLELLFEGIIPLGCALQSGGMTPQPLLLTSQITTIPGEEFRSGPAKTDFLSASGPCVLDNGK